MSYFLTSLERLLVSSFITVGIITAALFLVEDNSLTSYEKPGRDAYVFLVSTELE